MTAETFGAFVGRVRREGLEMSLREFCERNGLDPGNLSRLERGKLPPPRSREVLDRYAASLELREGSDDWLLFYDLAAAGRGEVPEDLMADEDVVSQLPVLFRTLRGDRVDDAKLQELIRLIRGA
jgi:transcriptional regulator with XRE-family HTH domain